MRLRVWWPGKFGLTQRRVIVDQHHLSKRRCFVLRDSCLSCSACFVGRREGMTCSQIGGVPHRLSTHAVCLFMSPCCWQRHRSGGVAVCLDRKVIPHSVHVSLSGPAGFRVLKGCRWTQRVSFGALRTH